MLAILASCLSGSANQTAPVPPAAEQTFIISGLVVRHDNRRPIPHVMITITRNDHPDQQVSLKTADDGRFTFTAVPKGKYTLSAEYRGVTQSYREDGAYSTGIAAGPGIDSEHVTFPMILPASLSISVLDEEGEPVREAQPMLFHKHVEQGRAVISTDNGTHAYVNGVHRYSHVEPGTYFVGLQGRPWYAQDHRLKIRVLPQTVNTGQSVNGPNLDVVYPMTYYPNVLDPEAAKAITIREGENARIEISVRAVPALRVVVHGPGFDRSSDSENQQNVGANLMSIGPGGVLFSLSTSSSFGEQYEITGVPPGRHVISLTRFTGQNGSENEMLQSGIIDMSEDYSLNVSELSRTALTGRIVADGAPLPARSQLFLRNLQSNYGFGAQIRSDGSLSMQNPLLPGRYQLNFYAQGLYVKSLAVTGASYDAGTLDVKSGAAIDLTITAAQGTFSADGIALTDGKPTPGAMVLLIPEDPNYVGEFPRDQSDSDGTFTLPNVHPGQYRLVAIDDGRDLEYHNPVVMKPYLAGLAPITFPLNGNVALQVNVQKRQP